MQHWQKFFVIILILLFTTLGVLNVYKYIEHDQFNLLYDAERFLRYFRNGEYGKTLVSTRTGVTVSWLISIVEILKERMGLAEGFVFQRLFLYSVRVVILIVAYLISKTLFTKKVAVSFGLFLLISPMLTAGTETTWLDKFVSLFGLCTVLLWVLYNIQGGKRVLIYTGIAFGLTALTKPVGVLCFGLLAIMFGGKSLFTKRYITGLITVGLIGLITFTVLYPAMWVDPLRVLFIRGINDQGSVQLAVGGDGTNSILYYPERIIKTDLALSIGLLLLLWEGLSVVRKKIPVDLPFRIGFAGLLYIVIIVVIGLVFVDTDTGPGAFFAARYLTPAIPLVGLYLLSRIMSLENRVVLYLMLAIVFSYSVVRLRIIEYYWDSMLLYL